MYRHSNHLDAKKNLEKDGTKLPRYYVYLNGTLGRRRKVVYRNRQFAPGCRKDAVPPRALQAGRDFTNGVQTTG
jgi:hypothetical protein